MKWLLVLSFVLALTFVHAAEDETCTRCSISTCNGCYDDAKDACLANPNKVKSENLSNCNAVFSGFANHTHILQRYANHQIEKSFEYLLLAANFGTYAKNRPGFEKQFRALSDRSWNNGIDLIKHITKRGGAHNFSIVSSHVIVEDNEKCSVGATLKPTNLDFNEIQALSLTLSYEKMLALEAHHIHEKYSHAKHPKEYDPEVAHFIEEKFLEDQAETIRKLSGYVNDLKRLSKDTTDVSLALYLFDDYLVKQ